MQCDLADTDADGATLHIGLKQNSFFSYFDLLHSRSDMRKEFLTLWSKLDIAACTAEQCTTKCLFQIFDGSGHIGLIAVELFRCFGETAVLSHIVEHPVGIQIDMHDTTSGYIKSI